MPPYILATVLACLSWKFALYEVPNLTYHGEFEKLVAKEINEQIDELRVKLALINNELIVDYNFDLKMRSFKKLLIELKELNGNYDDFDFKRLYSNVVINSRTNIIFNLNFRTIKHDEVLNEHLILPTSTTFIIRKPQLKLFTTLVFS